MIDTSAATSRQEKVKIITDKLEQGIQNLLDSDRYKEYLSKMSKLHHYSFNNTVLILMQRPDATMVAGMNSWRENFNRTIVKGSKSITVLAPAPYKHTVEKPDVDADGNYRYDSDGNVITKKTVVEVPSFKPVWVFDVSDTQGEPIPTLGVDELKGSVENYDKLLEAVISASPVPVEFDRITSGAKGYYSDIDKKIVISEGMSELQVLKTCCHEVSHSLLHTAERLKSTGDMSDKRTFEVEAESIAYTVCSYLGLPTDEYSFGYIAGWAGERELSAVKESLEVIRKTSSDIITAIERHLNPERSLNIGESQTQTKHKARSA